jgi:antitoxin MazE
MEANIIKIGNSKGVRLSKTILEKYQIGDKEGSNYP